MNQSRCSDVEVLHLTEPSLLQHGSGWRKLSYMDIISVHNLYILCLFLKHYIT